MPGRLSDLDLVADLTPCKKCGGAGQVNGRECKPCEGSGCRRYPTWMPHWQDPTEPKPGQRSD